MPERGGPTTQSGILYQNSVAALYLGRLLDPETAQADQKIRNVRLEAPEKIDDIVVEFADRSRLLIQAKESLSVGSAPWVEFWSHLAHQSNEPNFEVDSILLVVGRYSSALDQLRELCDRSRGKRNSDEWTNALGRVHKALLSKISSASRLKTEEAFQVLRQLRIQFLTFEQIDTFGIRDHIPKSSVPADTLFSILRDLCGGAARVRASFDATTLTSVLGRKHGIELRDLSHTWRDDGPKTGGVTETGKKTRPYLGELPFIQSQSRLKRLASMPIFGREGELQRITEFVSANENGLLLIRPWTRYGGE